MHNIGYEFKKILSNKLTIYIFLICFLVNGFVIVTKPNSIRGFYDNKRAYDEMYVKLSGDVTKENVDFVTKEYERLNVKFITNTFSPEYSKEFLTGYEAGDYMLYREMYEKFQYIESYEESLEEVRNISEENAVFYDKTGKKELQAYNERIVDTYTDRHISGFYETKNYKYYLDYAFSNLCILLVLIAALKGVFSVERESNMSTLILTSRYGKIKTFLGKMFAGGLVAFIVTVLFLVEDFVLFVVTFGYKGLMEPIYSVEEMRYCIYDVSIMEYILIMGVVKLTGMLVLGAVIMLASAISNSNLTAIVLSVLGILPMIVVNKDNGICNAIRLLNITEDAKKINCLSVMGSPIIYIDYSLVTCVILAIICVILSCLIETRYGKVFRRERA